MKSQLDRELIEGLNESSNQEFFENVNEIMYELVTNVITDISAKSPFVRVEKCILQPANEIFTGAFSQRSTYDYFLGVDNTQIEFNSKTKKNHWKYIWREFKASWRLGKKKYKKSKKEKQQHEQALQSIDKYKLSDFRHDIVNKMAQYLTDTSIIYEHMRNISIIGADDFGTGVKVNVYIGVYDSKRKVFKLFNEAKNKFTEVDFADRFSNIEYKQEECGEMYVNMIKIFNALFAKAHKRVPNQILVESLVYNCPKVLFDQKDVYKTFVNVANYIRLVNPRDLVSICNPAKNIFEEPLILGNSSQLDFSKIISLLDKFKY
ncbi:MAG: hypothetical protein J6K39_02575 [Clostridia bacterium]|nr:hypothetical protein [Clostridia bacterium]